LNIGAKDDNPSPQFAGRDVTGANPIQDAPFANASEFRQLANTEDSLVLLHFFPLGWWSVVVNS
jgi:hypothetical protein